MSSEYYTGQYTLADLILSQLRQGVPLAKMREHLNNYFAANFTVVIPKLPLDWDVQLERRARDQAWLVWIVAPGFPRRNASCFRYLHGLRPYPYWQPSDPVPAWQAAELAEPVAEKGSSKVAPAVDKESSAKPLKRMLAKKLAAARAQRVRKAQALLTKKPDLKMLEVRERLPNKPIDCYTECEAEISGLKFREFQDALRAERERRRKLRKKPKPK